MTGKPLRLSINPQLIDKNVASDTRLFAEGFVNRRLTIRPLVEHIRQGHGFAAELNGRRNAANFVAADLVAVDVDEGMSIEEALQHPLVRDHAALIHTTVSHTEEAPRFRIIFRLAETITDPAKMRAIQRSLALRLGGDAAATDPARLFFGNRAALFPLVQDRALSLDLQNELIAQSEHALPRGGAIAARPTTQSKLRLDPDQLVTLAGGQVIALSNIRGNGQLHCPFHRDRNASAFVVRSERGTRGIHCAACRASFWPAEADEPDPFSFDAAVLQAHARHGENVCQSGLSFLFGLDGKANVKLVEDGTGFGPLMPGLTFIKAPKGAGKTESLKTVLPTVNSALFIVHRRSLTRQSCRRLAIPCYLDLDRLDHDRLGICFDSLLRLPHDRSYDLVVLDEVEQVLAHILADTIGGGERVVLFRKLVILLRAAQFVVAMDADIGWGSFATLTRLMTGVIPDPVQGDLFKDTSRQVRVLLNTSKPGTGKSVELYKSKAQLVAELVDALAKGQRVFVASTSKAFAAKISALIEQKLPNCRRLLLTADTASGEPQQNFLEAPAEAALNYDAIITSPAAGTGLDITFPDRAVMIDQVVGFCEADIVTHFDFDQHISRVRQPGAVKAWICPERLYYETHADVVRRDVLDGILRAHVVLNNAEDGSVPTIDDDPLVEMATMVVSQQRWSKNNIRKNFIAHKRAQGFSIVEVEPNADLRSEGADLLKMASAIGDKEYARRIGEARPLSRIGYLRANDAVEAGLTIPPDQWYSLARAKLEGFYREPFSDDLIERDRRGRSRGCVIRFESVTKMLPQAPAAIARQSAVIRDREQALALLRMLLDATPLIKNGGWDRDAVFCGEDLESFCRLVEKEKRAFETQLKAQVRRDLHVKPVLQLRHVLRMLGLGLERVRTEKVGTGKRYFYRLDHAVLRLLAEISDRRATTSAADFLRQLHGEIDDEDDDAEAFFLGSD